MLDSPGNGVTGSYEISVWVLEVASSSSGRAASAPSLSSPHLPLSDEAGEAGRPASSWDPPVPTPQHRS